MRQRPGAAPLAARYHHLSEAPERRVVIFTSVSRNSVAESLATGMVPGSGTFFCLDCSSQLSLRENDRLPDCPRCGASRFRRDSIFESMQDGETTAELAIPSHLTPPGWLQKARAELPRHSRYLVCGGDEEEIRVFPVKRGWIRIGRSVTADVRLNDPSVSRRHALVVSEPDAPLRVLDDRSLNGVFLNGVLIDWSKMADGDELKIGRYRLFVFALGS